MLIPGNRGAECRYEQNNTRAILAKEHCYRAAELAKDLRPVIAELERLKCGKFARELNGYTKLAGLNPKLSQAIALLREVADTLDNAVKADKQQALDRGMRELGLLCNRRASQIELDIPMLHRKRKDDAESWRLLSGELAKKGFTEAQIEKVLEDTPKPLGEQEHYLAVIQPLEDELEKLTAFIRDRPRYDQTLLIGTPFENWQPGPTEADIDPAALLKFCRGREIHADA